MDEFNERNQWIVSVIRVFSCANFNICDQLFYLFRSSRKKKKKEKIEQIVKIILVKINQVQSMLEPFIA